MTMGTATTATARTGNAATAPIPSPSTPVNRPGFAWRRQVFEVPCTIDLEHTAESLHAYVDLEGIEIGPGDEVIVHDAPVTVAPGEKLFVHRRATVIRAGVLDRLAAKVGGYMELTELYEVSFSEGRAA